MRKILWVAGAALALAGCASYDGRGLVPGTSTGPQVEALMGKPALRLPASDVAVLGVCTAIDMASLPDMENT